MKYRNYQKQGRRFFLISTTSIFLLLLSSWRTNSATPVLDSSARQRLFAWVDSAQMALDRRDLEQAPKFYQKALNLAQSQNDYLATAALQDLIGDLFERVGHYQKALQQYEFGIISLNTRQSGQLAEPTGEIIHRLQGM